jgi:tetratricopeptide (TPR) repeat protein
MRNHILLYLTLFFLNTNAQNKKNIDTDEKQKKYISVDIIKTYERVAEKGYKSVEMFQKLGNSFYLNSELEKAARWYCELFAMTSNLESEYYYRYAESLKSIGKNEEAKEILETFTEKSKDIKEITLNKKL